MTGYFVTSTHKMFPEIKGEFRTSSLDKLKSMLKHQTPDPERIDWEKVDQWIAGQISALQLPNWNYEFTLRTIKPKSVS